jgi:hypothetical protein
VGRRFKVRRWWCLALAVAVLVGVPLWVGSHPSISPIKAFVFGEQGCVIFWLGCYAFFERVRGILLATCVAFTLLSTLSAVFLYVRA